MGHTPEELNEKQKEAVLHHSGPLLVIAGAGTGKTKTLTYRIASLIEAGTSPERILAVTFTNKAAGEMRERVKSLLDSRSSFNRPVTEEARPFIATFHSLGVFLLRSHYEAAGLPKHFAISDRDRSKQLIKEAARREDMDPKTLDVGKVLGTISRQKNAFVTVEEYATSNERAADFIAPLWRTYEDLLKEEGLVDFDDLLVRPVRLLEEYSEIRRQYQTLWEYVHIDEYQDTNEVQCRLAHILSLGHRNICATGDLDQCIYSWRGARVDTILEFEKDYPEAQIVTLEQNYRSTTAILGAANKVIALNRRRKEKNLFTSNTDGERIEYLTSYTENEEARAVTEQVTEFLEEGVSASDIAILYRTNAQSRSLEEAFLNASLPYTVVGTKFLDRAEVRNVLAYIEASRNRKSTSVLKRIINTPPRGIGKTTFLRILEGREGDLNRRAQDNVASFRALLDRIEDVGRTRTPSELVKYVMAESGLEEYYKRTHEEERLENMQELASLASRFDEKGPDGLEEFLEQTVLSADQDALARTEEGESVKLMTVHAAKGLEFEYVFITGLEEGLFPHEPMGNEARDEEEERRLFYVALTRARKKAVLSSAQTRTIFGSTHVHVPSRFISDIGSEFLEERTQYETLENEEEVGDGGLLSRPPLPPIG